VGACVGVRGARIRNISDELNGERIDVIRWNDEPQTLIMNALKPADIVQITLNDDTHQAEVIVNEAELSLAIGKRGQNVRLAAKLTGWDINIVSATDSSVQASGRAEEEDEELFAREPGTPGGGVTEMMAVQVVDAAGDQLRLSGDASDTKGDGAGEAVDDEIVEGAGTESDETEGGTPRP
jgi:hypothetical protein